ncbi:head completion/stabilization protein [uncultured Sphingomonas sp.]|uniref:head completion/stabilization protein n=1 Tax=uncultured Sphingomonas sp. TaxID=158754 RepID=UPI0026001C7D|nr:head completion/stabilization protein [uncultured Sphingomonas sp.]
MTLSIPIKTSAAPVAPGSTAPIRNDGWLPDIEPDALRAGYRIREVVTPERLRTAVIGAIMAARADLRSWCAARLAAGYASLADVPADKVDGESVLVLSYRRAIGAYVRAELIEGYRDTDLTGRGDRKVDDLEPSVDELRRDAIHAIRDMLEVGRTTVELI